jgi:hypothetical protein
MSAPTPSPFAPARGAVLAALLFLGGCTGPYFHDAGTPPAPPAYTLGTLPFREYWTGIVFNGEKIGFTHLALEPAGDGDWRIRATASLDFHFLGVDKEVKLLSEDVVAADLTLRRLHHDYNLDGNTLGIDGAVAGGTFDVAVTTRNGTERSRLPVADRLYPASIINLYPVLHGLEPGRRYAYPVYDGETQRVIEVRQAVLGYEESTLFAGPAWKIETRMHGNTVTTWINGRGEPVLEMSMHGIFIAGLEPGEYAKRELALGALNKRDTLLDFSLVTPDRPIAAPRDTASLRVALTGLDGFPLPPPAPRQTCAPSGGEVHCALRAGGAARAAAAPGDLEAHLAPSLPVPARHPVIRALAQEIAAGHTAVRERIAAVLAWLERNIAREAVDVFTALDVLERRKAECQGFSYLYASLARALGIPTRLASGLVYSAEHGGFLYHTWAESWIGGGWLAVDPTFGQPEADATHIKLVDGENLGDLAPLLGVIGRLGIRVIDVN